MIKGLQHYQNTNLPYFPCGNEPVLKCSIFPNCNSVGLSMCTQLRSLVATSKHTQVEHQRWPWDLPWEVASWFGAGIWWNWKWEAGFNIVCFWNHHGWTSGTLILAPSGHSLKSSSNRRKGVRTHRLEIIVGCKGFTALLCDTCLARKLISQFADVSCWVQERWAVSALQGVQGAWAQEWPSQISTNGLIPITRWMKSTL